jgi:hypothetical protein
MKTRALKLLNIPGLLLFALVSMALSQHFLIFRLSLFSSLM